jgi:hypothetical protein
MQVWVGFSTLVYVGMSDSWILRSASSSFGSLGFWVQRLLLLSVRDAGATAAI